MAAFRTMRRLWSAYAAGTAHSLRRLRDQVPCHVAAGGWLARADPRGCRSDLAWGQAGLIRLCAGAMVAPTQ